MTTVSNTIWYSIDAGSAPFFRLGEQLYAGAIIGLSGAGGEPIRVEETGEIVEVQYDLWHDRVFVVLRSPTADRERRAS